jgi:epi-isozizaene 5-monooxygenase
VRDGEVHIVAAMMQLAMNIASRTLLGIDISEQFREISRCLDTVMHDFLVRFRTPIPPLYWLPTPANLRLKRTIRRLDQILQELIDERRAAGATGGDFLSLLLAPRRRWPGHFRTDSR